MSRTAQESFDLVTVHYGVSNILMGCTWVTQRGLQKRESVHAAASIHSNTHEHICKISKIAWYSTERPLPSKCHYMICQEKTVILWYTKVGRRVLYLIFETEREKNAVQLRADFSQSHFSSLSIVYSWELILRQTAINERTSEVLKHPFSLSGDCLESWSPVRWEPRPLTSISQQKRQIEFLGKDQ